MVVSDSTGRERFLARNLLVKTELMHPVSEGRNFFFGKVLRDRRILSLIHILRCGRYRMDANGQTILSKEEVGFIKVLFAADSDVLLGAQIMCQRATDMIGELATAIANGLTSRQLMYAMRAHPTFNEAVSKAVEDSREEKKSAIKSY